MAAGALLNPGVIISGSAGGHHIVAVVNSGTEAGGRTRDAVQDGAVLVDGPGRRTSGGVGGGVWGYAEANDRMEEM